MMALVTYENTLVEWENIIRTNLKVANPALLKSGALGILTNYLAGIKYDALQFYSKSFQEMNVGLAQDFDSMLFHSTIYGITIDYATPATLTSSLIIPETNIAADDTLVYNIPGFTKFVDTNGIPFTFTSEIRIDYNINGIQATAWNPQNGTRKLIINKVPNPNVPGSNIFLIHNQDAQQFERQFNYFTTPAYKVGESFQFSVSIESILNLKDLYVWVNTGKKLTQDQKFSLEYMDPEDIEGAFYSEGVRLKRLEVRYYKYDSSARDDHIFASFSEHSINFETGDGVHGGVLPENTEIIVDAQITLGENGNVPNSEFLITNVTVGNRNFITSINGVSTAGSYGGRSIQEIDGIRENIFDQITVRNSIITENDYERLFKFQDTKPFVDAKFLDAKAFVFIFNVIHSNDNVVNSNSFNIKENDLMSQPFFPIVNYKGVDLVSPFYYKVRDENSVDAYIVNPLIPFNLTEDPNSPNIGTTTDYRADVYLAYEFERTQLGMTGRSYFKVDNIPSESYIYKISCSWLSPTSITLSNNNGYTYEISTLYTDAFCIVRDPTKNIVVEVYDANQPNIDGEPSLVAIFSDNASYHQLIKKQTLWKYYLNDEEPDQIPEQSREITAYFDNSISDIMATTTDILAKSDLINHTAYLLRVPFIDLEWLQSKQNNEVFEILDNYFIIPYIEEAINYNTQLTQTFHNTIDIPQNYYEYLFEENSMPPHDSPKINIEISIYLDKDSFLTSKFETLTDFELDAKINIIKFLKQKEGFNIEFFETELEKYLYNIYTPLIKNIRVESPTLFRINNAATIYNLIQDNLDFREVLDFVPPYFYYDYENIKLNISF